MTGEGIETGLGPMLRIVFGTGLRRGEEGYARLRSPLLCSMRCVAPVCLPFLSQGTLSMYGMDRTRFCLFVNFAEALVGILGSESFLNHELCSAASSQLTAPCESRVCSAVY